MPLDERLLLKGRVHHKFVAIELFHHVKDTLPGTARHCRVENMTEHWLGKMSGWPWGQPQNHSLAKRSSSVQISEKWRTGYRNQSLFETMQALRGLSLISSYIIIKRLNREEELLPLGTEPLRITVPFAPCKKHHSQHYLKWATKKDWVAWFRLWRINHKASAANQGACTVGWAPGDPKQLYNAIYNLMIRF